MMTFIRISDNNAEYIWISCNLAPEMISGTVKSELYFELC